MHSWKPPAVFAAALAASALVFSPQHAHAGKVERIVAVVGERPVLFSELWHRARPELARYAEKDPNVRAAAEMGIFRNQLNRMIDERLEEQAAEKARISVTPEEVDRGIQNLAANQNATPQQLEDEARRLGLTEQDFRDEVRRQILEGKLLELRVRPRVRVTEQDARSAYQRYQQAFAERSMVDIRILALRILPNATEEQVKSTLALSDNIVARARTGEDFCAMVLKYTQDPSCGSRGPQPLQALIPPVRDQIPSMKPRDVGTPIRIQQPGVDMIIVFQLAETPRVPTYEEKRDEMMQIALADGIEHQRRLWLQELRRGVYIDVRL